jgi:hypothetical protein
LRVRLAKAQGFCSRLIRAVRCFRVRSVTTFGDVLLLNGWVNVRSKLSWIGSVLIAAVFSATTFGPNLWKSDQTIARTLLLIFALFAVALVFIWLASFVVILLVAILTSMRRGCLGPKKFEVGTDGFTEDDGYQITAVSWKHVRSIDKTRHHIFLRVSKWKYMLLAARDFETECHFAQYYAALVKAKHENT